MNHFRSAAMACLLLVALAACDVPTPPPELPTPTPGSQNPESELSGLNRTPLRLTPERGFTPIAAPPGHIYFVRSSKLWRIAPDGSGEMLLADLPVTARPQPSPDGRMVAFISGRDLYVTPSEGGSARKLFSDDLAERQRLGWTADSSMIGYITYDLATVGNEKAWAIPAAGGEPLAITTLTGGAVARGATYERSVLWSPDGKWVVVSAVNNPMRLLRWPLSAGREGDVRDIPGGEPDWSPDGRTLVYTESLNGALALYNVLEAEGEPFRNEEQFVGTGMGEYTKGPGPLWSPASSGSDSDPIAYRSRSPEGETRISIRQRSGNELRPLPALTNNPAWSPSGDQLVVETGHAAPDPLGPRWIPTGLAIVHLNLQGEHTLKPFIKDAQWPAWGK